MLRSLRRRTAQLLAIREFRIIAGRVRYFYFKSILKRLRTIDSSAAIENTTSHNLKALKAFGGSRMDKLIKPLSVLENVSKDSKILVIGPRNEDDLLNLSGHGFELRNIIGLDLITYSPLIQLGDMHHTTFDDSTFDVILCGWTLSYSDEPELFAQEMLRIIKPNGVIGIGIEYSTMTSQQAIKIHGGYDLKPSKGKRINSTDEIIYLFDGHVNTIFFNHDAPNKISHSDTLNPNVSSVITIFSIEK